MKQFLKTVGIMLICGALAVPGVDAQSRGRGHNNSGGNTTQRTAPASRPGNSGSGASQSRGGNGGGAQVRPNRNNNKGQAIGQGHNTNRRPGNMGQGSQSRPNVRPGNNGSAIGNGASARPNGSLRPGNNHGNVNRPNGGGMNRPPHDGGISGGPMGNHRPDFRPNHPAPPHYHGHGPGHPNRYPYYGWHRPAPPVHWRPAPGWRPFRSVLGINFGTTIGLSLNFLINNGISIASYGTNDIYVSNVPMLGLNWPDAELFYNDMGGLCGSRFIYSTGYYDLNRYNMAYASLVNGYGAPISIQNTASGMEATWWGTDGQFIRLAFTADYAIGGGLRYFTTLSFGN